MLCDVLCCDVLYCPLCFDVPITCHLAPRLRSNRSRSRSSRIIDTTLIALLVALVGERVRVELRNETDVRGRLEQVAPDMTYVRDDTTQRMHRHQLYCTMHVEIVWYVLSRDDVYAHSPPSVFVSPVCR